VNAGVGLGKAQEGVEDCGGRVARGCKKRQTVEALGRKGKGQNNPASVWKGAKVGVAWAAKH